MNQFYSMLLYKAEILKYLKSEDDTNFKLFIIQFYGEDYADGTNFKMRGWALLKDHTAYPTSGNLLEESSVITTDIPTSPFYFTNCELTRSEFKKDILDKVGGLKGDWEYILLTPLQIDGNYLAVELSVETKELGDAASTIANPRPPYPPA